VTDHLRALLDRLAVRDDSAWPEFLRDYAPLLLQVAREAERDADHAADAFLFICQHLAADHYRRLRQFGATGGASFATWLRVVAWNLALDARRQRRGRFRPLAVIKRLPILQQRLYALRYEERLSSDQAFAILQPEFPGLSRDAAQGAEAEVDRAIGSKQRFLLAVRRPVVESLDAPLEDGSAPGPEPVDAGLDPEMAAILGEQSERLRDALATLDPADRLLLQLRFEQDVTLSRIATMLGLKDPWSAVRQLERALRRLRAALDANDRAGSV
jgi:RNA polymerase sigma factor (sigma-70 family)